VKASLQRILPPYPFSETVSCATSDSYALRKEPLWQRNRLLHIPNQKAQTGGNSTETPFLSLDPAKLSVHIAEAEKALVQRGRELAQETGDNREEEQSLDDAMHFLRALHSFSQSNA
jgi:hypothetical protein